VTVTAPDLRFGADGLAPAIVQDVADGTVLMLGWMDAEALDATIATGDVHFHSRSRDTLWRKGETSGNFLRLVDIATDCDADALLVTAEPTGPTGHRGTRTCVESSPAGSEGRVAFDGEGDPTARQGFATLETLWTTISARATDRPAGSYTAALLNGGVDATARKVAEEATEVVMAAKDDAAAESNAADRTATQHALAGEVGDLVYHALVLLAERGVPPSLVLDELRARAR